MTLITLIALILRQFPEISAISVISGQVFSFAFSA